MIRWFLFAAALALTACTSKPQVPDWQLNARSAVERATQADLQGHRRVAQLEWRRAFEETRRTADPTRWARVVLVQCAVQQAMLQLRACEAFLPWAAEATEADRAYARYLEGQPLADDLPWLAESHRPVARQMLELSPLPPSPVLVAIADPLSRLVAASSMLRAGQLDPPGIAVAVDTASAMGWRQPLLAWLLLQAETAQAAGDQNLADQARRRIDLLSVAATARPAQKAD
jgi:hypothetical protein